MKFIVNFKVIIFLEFCKISPIFFSYLTLSCFEITFLFGHNICIFFTLEYCSTVNIIFSRVQKKSLYQYRVATLPGNLEKPGI